MAAAVWAHIDKLLADGIITYEILAQRLNISVKSLKRKLKSPGSWTLNTISEILSATESRITNIEIMTYKEISQMQTKIVNE